MGESYRTFVDVMDLGTIRNVTIYVTCRDEIDKLNTLLQIFMFTGKYRYSERRKGVNVAAAIKISGASNRTRHLRPPFCLLFRARARGCEKTWVQVARAKPSTNQTKVSFAALARKRTTRYQRMKTQIVFPAVCVRRTPRKGKRYKKPLKLASLHTKL